MFAHPFGVLVYCNNFANKTLRSLLFHLYSLNNESILKMLDQRSFRNVGANLFIGLILNIKLLILLRLYVQSGA